MTMVHTLFLLTGSNLLVNDNIGWQIEVIAWCKESESYLYDKNLENNGIEQSNDSECEWKKKKKWISIDVTMLYQLGKAAR